MSELLVYRPRVSDVIAIEYTYPASETIKKLLGPDYIGEQKARCMTSKGVLTVRNKKGRLTLLEGNMLIQDGNGEFSSSPKLRFTQMYEATGLASTEFNDDLSND
jgi:hypothetical protein